MFIFAFIKILLQIIAPLFSNKKYFHLYTTTVLNFPFRAVFHFSYTIRFPKTNSLTFRPNVKLYLHFQNYIYIHTELHTCILAVIN